MRLATVIGSGERHLAVVTDGGVLDVTAVAGGDSSIPESVEELLTAGPDGIGAVSDLVDATGPEGLHGRDDVRFAAPLAGPRQILAIGRNYLDHVGDTSTDLPDRPRIFPKWASTLVGSGDPIVKPAMSEEVDWEVELAVVIGRPASRVEEADALDHVFGYTLLNDITARDVQNVRPEQLALAKNFRSFTPMGAWICTADEIEDPHDLRLRTLVNSEIKQDASTELLIFDVRRLISFLSHVLDLGPGDVISTGTPAGMGAFRTPPEFLQPGDRVRLEMLQGDELMCVLENDVVAEEA